MGLHRKSLASNLGCPLNDFLVFETLYSKNQGIVKIMETSNTGIINLQKRKSFSESDSIAFILASNGFTTALEREYDKATVINITHVKLNLRDEHTTMG